MRDLGSTRRISVRSVPWHLRWHSPSGTKWSSENECQICAMAFEVTILKTANLRTESLQVAYGTSRYEPRIALAYNAQATIENTGKFAIGHTDTQSVLINTPLHCCRQRPVPECVAGFPLPGSPACLPTATRCQSPHHHLSFCPCEPCICQAASVNQSSAMRLRSHRLNPHRASQCPNMARPCC